METTWVPGSVALPTLPVQNVMFNKVLIHLSIKTRGRIPGNRAGPCPLSIPRIVKIQSQGNFAGLKREAQPAHSSQWMCHMY